jgi:DNA polymerase delta subunit 1
MAGIAPPRKRVRTDIIKDPFSFEEELASFHSLERSGSATCSSRWCRPDPPLLSSAHDEVIFQQIDIDHYVGDPVEGMPGARNGSVPIMRMYGVTMEGNSVCAHIHGFLPYFYVPAPSESFANEDCDRLRHLLNDAVLGDMRSNKDGITQAVYAIELCSKCSMLGFHFNRLFPFLKITVATPKLVPSARRVLNNISMPQYGSMSCQSFESNVDFEVRFMVDTGTVGCNWIKCPPGVLILHARLLIT